MSSENPASRPKSFSERHAWWILAISLLVGSSSAWLMLKPQMLEIFAAPPTPFTGIQAPVSVDSAPAAGEELNKTATAVADSIATQLAAKNSQRAETGQQLTGIEKG